MPDVRIEDLNAGVLSSPASFVFWAEREYENRIRELAERIGGDNRLRVVFIAGPSGSGKTTTANLLADAVIGCGRRCIVLSLDDFYLAADSPTYPRNPDGTPNFETVYALDLDAIADTLSDIAADRAFKLPKYDFKKSRRVAVNEHAALDGGVVIIEGLHALNPLISAAIPKEVGLKIFISVSTNITKDGERIISGRKLRFLRRMIRDSIYRATSPEQTVEMWGGVLAGEDEYLYPTRKYADIDFDTFHAFELSVMRPFAEALITEPVAERSVLARVALAAARCAAPIDLSLLPETSLIREFVPGGIYEDLY